VVPLGPARFLLALDNSGRTAWTNTWWGVLADPPEVEVSALARDATSRGKKRGGGGDERVDMGHLGNDPDTRELDLVPEN